jgi:hypothetical protein
MRGGPITAKMFQRPHCVLDLRLPSPPAIRLLDGSSIIVSCDELCIESQRTYHTIAFLTSPLLEARHRPRL